MNDPVTRVLKRVFVIVLLACATIFIWGTVKTYQGAPPIPNQIQTSNGSVVMTQNQIIGGKAGFQEADLMDYGSVYGNGAYFEEDWTALSLHQIALNMDNAYAQIKYGKSYNALSGGQQYDIRAVTNHELQNPVFQGKNLIVSQTEATAINQVSHQLAYSVLHTNQQAGYAGAAALNPQSAQNVGDFLVYTGWTAVAHRPGLDYSYTNDWPYDPLVGNQPTGATFIWSWASIGLLLAAIGVTIYLYFAHITSPKMEGEKEEAVIKGFPAITLSQRKTGKYFVSVAILFLIQIGAGMGLAHYYSERSTFFGINMLTVLPFNALKAVHIQLAIFWIAVAWIGAGLFLAPLISGKEPKHQGLLVDILFVALWVVGLSTLFGLYAGIKGWLPGNSWFWFGNQGLSYLQLGRFDQLALFAGLWLWVYILARAMWPVLRGKKGFGTLEHLFLYSGMSIAFMYVFGMFPVTWIMNSFTLTDFWRWWVVHLWVEGTFEFFAIVAISYLLVELGFVSRKTAERVTWFEMILVFLGGIVGTGHHMYWVGEPWIWLGLGSMFSFIEVMPLLLMIVEAVENHRHMKDSPHFVQKSAFTYLVGSGVWNFFGAGVFGGMINAPLINYYEHGTFLTLGHAHTSMFGAFGMLGIGLAYFALRYIVGDDSRWSDKPAVVSFWLFNIGMILWCVLNFFPIGFAQLLAVYTHSYVYARSLQFYNTTLLWQWLRMPGDIAFGAGGVVIAWDFIKKVSIAHKIYLSTQRAETTHGRTLS